MQSKKKFNAKGFTLIELLTVIGVITILSGFLLAGIHKVRIKARMASCKNNLQQFSRAVDIFRGNLDDFPDFLSNLFRTYIDTRETYICPSDRSKPKGSEGGKPTHEAIDHQFNETDDTASNVTWKDLRNNPGDNANNRIDNCSYLYEFCGADCSWKTGYTWKQAKLEEMAEGVEDQQVYGHVPLVRCFWHIKPDGNSYVDKKMVINVAVEDRNIFMSDATTKGWTTQE